MRETDRRAVFEEAEREFRAATCRLARAARLGDACAARAAFSDLQARAGRASRLYGDACSSECRCRKCTALEGVDVGFKSCAGCEVCGVYPAQRDDFHGVGQESFGDPPYPVRPALPYRPPAQRVVDPRAQREQREQREQRALAERAAWRRKSKRVRADQDAMQKRADASAPQTGAPQTSAPSDGGSQASAPSVGGSNTNYLDYLWSGRR